MADAGATPRPRPDAGAASGVRLSAVNVHYGRFHAVQDFSLTLERGEFVTLLGPSGCGKTTVLRALAGLAPVSSGMIEMGGRRIEAVPIHRRNIGLVFQNYALFPHRSVFDNVAFGLRYRAVPKAEIADRVARALAMVRLEGSGAKLPAELSGGQQQRIALARAIVIEPDLLLLDEPLSALDANMREEMRVEIRKIQRQTGLTALFVTHDQGEALAMSDRIVVMNRGRVEQVDRPQALWARPDTAFVAGFLGGANLLPGTVEGVAAGRVRLRLASGALVEVEAPPLPPGSAATLVIRPQLVRLAPGGDGPGLAGIVTAASFLGHRVIYELACGGLSLRAESAPLPGLAEGAPVRLCWDPADALLLGPDGRRPG